MTPTATFRFWLTFADSSKYGRHVDVVVKIVTLLEYIRVAGLVDSLYHSPR